MSTSDRPKLPIPASRRTQPCPCPDCKPRGIQQIPATIRNHRIKHEKLAQALLLSIVVPNPVAADPETFAPPQNNCERHHSETPSLELRIPGSPGLYYSPSADEEPRLYFPQSPPLHLPRSPDSYRSPTHDTYDSDCPSNGSDNLGDDPDLDLDSASLLSLSACSRTPSPFEDSDVDSSEGSTDSEDGDERLDIHHDPLYRTNGAVFEPYQPNEPTPDGNKTRQNLPPAFYEHPVLRNAYIHVFVNSAYRGATHAQVQDSLTSTRSTIITMLEGKPPPDGLDLDNMARTLRTVENRLGVNPDDLITYFILCPDCWHVYHPSELSTLVSPQCQTKQCNGVLYKVKRTSSGTDKRTPIRSMPAASIKKAIANLLMRPGKWDEMQHWRKDSDHGPSEPITMEEWSAMLDPLRPLKDIHDGWIWRSLTTGFQRTWTLKTHQLQDTETHRIAHRFVCLPGGIVIHFNIDWFKSLSGGSYSTGVLWVSIDNLPRAIRFLRENTFLILVIPGPHEPTTDQLNGLMEPFVQELRDLEEGEDFPVFGHEDTEHVEVALPLGSIDTPARVKVGGYPPVTSELFMCPGCNKRFSSLVHKDCFDRSTFEYRDCNKQLRYKFLYRDSTKTFQEKIAAQRGVRYAALDSLVNWAGPLSLPPEAMHLMFLGNSSHIHRHILIDGGMFSGTGKRNEQTPMDRLTGFLETLIWPARSGRFNIKIASGRGRPKADEWRNLMRVYPVALAVAWKLWDRDKNDTAPMPRTNTKVAATAKKTAALLKKRRTKNIAQDPDADADDYIESADLHPSRNYADHYVNVLRFCASTRILTAHEIAPLEALRGQTFLSDAFQSWASMNCHLKPNAHNSMHLYEYILMYGPFYGWWVYCYERFIGTLAKFKNNGHGGGELEGTFMRGWWKVIRCQELVGHLQSLPDRTSEDDAAMDVLLEAMKGGAENERQRGTLLNHLAALAQEENAGTTVFPKQYKVVNLRSLGVYPILLRFVQALWPEKHIVSDTGAMQIGTPFYSTNIRSYSTIKLRGIKYGSSLVYRGKGYCHVYTHGRNAAKIRHIFALSIPQSNDAPNLEVDVAIVQYFEPNPVEVPWQAWSVDSGIHVWKKDTFGDIQVIELKNITGDFIVGSFEIPGKDTYWVTFSLDNTSQEPDTRNEMDDEYDE